MTEERYAYRQIMKATTLFGGLQVINIIISIVRSKLVAILLGPSGMGIMGLLYSTLGLIGGITNFGLGTSAVKDVSAANNSKDNEKFSLVINVFRRLVWITGLFGSLLVIVLSSWLSQLTFGNKEYTFAFVWISITLLFKQLSSGQLVILQGMRKLKHLAKANLVGSILGLFVSIPLYYFLGVDGIVPAIISTSVISLVLSWIFTRKIKIEPKKITVKETFTLGRNMMNVGFMITLGGLLSSLGAYIIRIFISNAGGIEQVGLYQAGFAIINMYLGIILQGMSTDYYPRLSAVSKQTDIFNQTINKQTEIGILILGPLLIIFMVFVKLAIILFYTKQFLPISDMITWAALGMLFRGPSWCLSFVFLAKSEGTLYFYLKLLSESLLVGLSTIGYYMFGLTGIGVSTMVMYPTYLLFVYKINSKRIKFEYEHSSIKMFIIQFGLAVLAFITVLFLKSPYNFIVGIIVILASGYHSLYHLNKRLGLIQLLKNYFKNRNQTKKK